MAMLLDAFLSQFSGLGGFLSRAVFCPGRFSVPGGFFAPGGFLWPRKREKRTKYETDTTLQPGKTLQRIILTDEKLNIWKTEKLRNWFSGGPGTIKGLEGSSVGVGSLGLCRNPLRKLGCVCKPPPVVHVWR